MLTPHPLPRASHPLPAACQAAATNLLSRVTYELTNLRVDSLTHVLMHSCTSVRAQVVILSQLLGHECTLGYDAQLTNTVVLQLNGQRVDSLAQLAHELRHSAAPSLRFDLEPQRMLVLDAAQARAAEGEILAQHNIPRPVSINPSDALLSSPPKVAARKAAKAAAGSRRRG